VTKPWFKAFVIAKASILDRLLVALSAFMTWEWCGEALKKPDFARIIIQILKNQTWESHNGRWNRLLIPSLGG